MTPEKIERDRTAGTPGPWRVGPVDDTVVIAPDGSEVAAIDGDYNEPDLWPVMEANARRIARLPELEQAYLDLTAEVRRLTAERDAALAGAMRVRKLVWTGDCYGWRSGVYSILPSYGQGPKRFMLSHGSNIIGWFDGEEEAQAAAQSDHEARVRAALEPAAPSVSAAETILARLDPEALRPILSRLANKTPTTCYYSEDFAETMRALPEKAATEAGKMPPLEQGLMFVAATAGGRLSVGDKLAAEFTSIMHGAQDVGSYLVRIERLATKENSDE